MYNNVGICGRMTKDPEKRAAGNGFVCEFTIAVERNYKRNGEKLTDFINCVAWNNAAEYVASYGAKGRTAIVNGSLEIRKYTDKSGNARQAAEIRVDNVYFFGGGNDNGGEYKAAQAAEKPQQANNGGFAFLDDEGDEGLPF